MAISKNLYTRGLKQRLAGAVWYQQKGRTLVRELAASVSNPQTEDQMDNRVKMSNCVAIYRANAEWMKKYAFEVKKNFWSVYNAFMSANLSANDILLAKSDVELGAAVAAPYTMTKGSLPSVKVEFNSSEDYFATDLYTGDLLVPYNDTTTTVADLSAALLANNNGLHEGDQLSFVWNIQTLDANGIPNVIARYQELIIDTTDTTTLADRLGQGVVWTDPTGTASMNALVFNIQSGAEVQAALCCVSRDNGSKVLVSTQKFVLTSDSVLDTFKGSAARQRAIRSYASGVENPFLAGGYQLSGDTTQSPISAYIVKARIGNGTLTSPGDYLGEVGVLTAFTILVQLSENISVDAPQVSAVSIFTSGNTTATSTQIARSGDEYTISYEGEAVNPSDPITKIVVAFDNGSTIQANFAENEDGTTE